jgi:AraC-like DNA-binding protein
MSVNPEYKVIGGYWFMEPLPSWMSVWLFKVNMISGKGPWRSFQKTPSGVTLRIVRSGEWTVSSRGVTKKALRGDVFCAVPSEAIDFRQTASGPWEWHEIQFCGPDAEKFIGEFGLSPENPVITPEKPEAALRLFSRINNYLRGEKRSVPELLALLFHLIHVCGKSPPGSAGGKSFSRETMVSRAIDMLESSPNMSMNINGMADSLGVDRTTLYRAFVAKTGKSPRQYSDFFRIMRAEEFLLKTDLPVALAARHTGFSGLKHFSQWFKKMRGMPPGEWRKKFR